MGIGYGEGESMFGRAVILLADCRPMDRPSRLRCSGCRHGRLRVSYPHRRSSLASVHLIPPTLTLPLSPAIRRRPHLPRSPQSPLTILRLGLLRDRPFVLLRNLRPRARDESRDLVNAHRGQGCGGSERGDGAQSDVSGESELHQREERRGKSKSN